MSVPDIHLPYGLRLVDLPFVDIICRYKPAVDSEKSESLRVSPTFGVILSRSESANEKPLEVTGKIAPEGLIPLLSLFESEGFFEMEEEDLNVDDSKGAVRSISLALPKRKKQVAVIGKPARSLDYLTGAAKMTAGLSVGEALRKDFLRDL
jgi:hypothetical protein